MTPTPELEAAVERLKEALDDFDRDLADVIDDEAFNVGQDESIEVSTADLRLVLASLPTGDMASRDHAPGEQRQAETEKLAALFKRACELVVHNLDCPARRSGRDADCACDAVPFLNDFEAIAKPEGL